MRYPVFCALALSLLTACGSGRERQAADACVAEISKRLAGKSYELDAKALAASWKSESADVMHLSTPIVFDKGLAGQYQQTVDCRVRFEADKSPSVIFLQFNWSMDDIKKS